MIDADPDEIRDVALKFEAVKMRMNQDKDGWTLTIRIQPNDVQSGDLSELLVDHVGTRYMIGMVRLGDQEQPVMSEAQLEGKRLVKTAGILCASDDFQRYLYKLSMIDDLSEEAAATFMRKFLGLESRAHLATAPQDTKNLFRKLASDFEDHMSKLPARMEQRR